MSHNSTELLAGPGIQPEGSPGTSIYKTAPSSVENSRLLDPQLEVQTRSPLHPFTHSNYNPPHFTPSIRLPSQSSLHCPAPVSAPPLSDSLRAPSVTSSTPQLNIDLNVAPKPVSLLWMPDLQGINNASAKVSAMFHDVVSEIEDQGEPRVC
jgi:hypothetical protein